MPRITTEYNQHAVDPAYAPPTGFRSGAAVGAGTGAGGDVLRGELAIASPGCQHALMDCPLCASPHLLDFAQREGRSYLRCPVCRLVVLHPDFRLDAGAERARYETHRNRPDDAGYRTFLGRLATPLMERLPPGAQGLDYGSGPGPTLALILAEAGFPTRSWDPFFDPDPEPLQRQYTFITCTETAEHFFAPGEEFRRLDALLEPGGWLGLMTGILHPDIHFSTWWYVRDPTHVAFYAPETLAWIAGHHGWEMEGVAPTVVLFRKPG